MKINTSSHATQSVEEICAFTARWRVHILRDVFCHRHSLQDTSQAQLMQFSFQ